MRRVAAVILAAGEAKRFRRSPDETKLVAELDGKPIVRHVAEAALASRARPVLLVTGHAHAQVLGALDGLMLERIHNRDPGAGLSASLKLAVSALPRTARGAVILLGDMPRIAPSLIGRLIDAFDAAPVEPLAVVPVRGGRRGNPALIGRGLFAAARTLQGNTGARDLIAAARENILELAVGDSAIEFDIDTREDLRRHCHVAE
ncbi:MAG: nucleotidyltransferase family protein [Methylocella sp.]|nr:MAG: 4-diphosphocytidyl-2C-methyl-D-erythritol kinase [Hyphomicrobiales bacterium]